MDCIVCLMCDRVTDTWVMWCSTYTEDAFWFCTNACLARWLVLVTPLDDYWRDNKERRR